MVKDKAINEAQTDKTGPQSELKQKHMVFSGKKKSPLLKTFASKTNKAQTSGVKFYPEHSKAFYSRSQPPLGTRFIRGFLGKPKFLYSKHQSPDQHHLNLRDSHEKKIYKFKSQQDDVIAEFMHETPRKRTCSNERLLLRNKGIRSCRHSKINDKKNIFNRLIASQREQKIVIDSKKSICLKKHPSLSAAVLKRKSFCKDKTLLKDFTNEFSALCAEVDFGSTGYLNYTKFCNILNKLKFLEDSFNKSEEERELVLKAWKLLGGHEESKVKIDNFYLFLLAVMNHEVKIERQRVNSPQSKHRGGFMSSLKKDIASIHQEFIHLYENRTEKKENQSIRINESVSSPEEIISGGETPEIVIDEASNIIQDISENNDVAPIEIARPEVHLRMPNSFKIIRRISLRELASTPKKLDSKLCMSVHHSTQSISENTPKNTSFNSESEDNILKSSLQTPPSQVGLGLYINKIKIKRMRTKNEESKKELNNSITYRTFNNIKFKFPNADSSESSGVLLDVSREISSDDQKK
ncbi:hypothetical protein SteCoe_37568 [Stentor coeruleus]|uniref:EF-hand domain-containing protein n=1 Tax=Stentor coeruleus TaxID=5963 RepID=A0A1R2AMR5_9CILI|nr:hypothetical protein SteCoe_37568 [Stentor coeruleus]